MNKAWPFWITGLLFLAGLGLIPQLFKNLPIYKGADHAVPLEPDRSYGHLPLCFEPNVGQTDPHVKYLAHGKGYTLYLASDEAVLVLNKPREKSKKLHVSESTKENKPSILRMKLVGANPNPTIEFSEKLAGISNYFIGNEPSKWRTNIPNYAKVKLKNVYPGIDMVYYGNQGQLEYDFVAAPGSDPKAIRFAFSGMNKKSFDEHGDFVVADEMKTATFKSPTIYQIRAGKKHILEGRYVTTSSQHLGFNVKEYDSSQPLVIDPVIDFSTYLGGGSLDGAIGISVDSNGNSYVIGSSTSNDFPTTTGAFQSTSGGVSVVFLTKINPNGNALVYSTFLGGTGGGGSGGAGIAIDTSGSAYLTGYTQTTDFPVTSGAFQTSPGGMFVTKLSPTGSSLIYSTYIGGDTYGTAIACDSSGNAYVTGIDISAYFHQPPFTSNYPTTAGAFDTNRGSSFVTKLNASGTGLLYSTLLGGTGVTQVDSGITYVYDADPSSGIAVDGTGNAYVVGITNSIDFPTTAGAFQTSPGSGYLTKLNPTGTSLVYSTYLNARCNGIAIDTLGDAYITGAATNNFVTTPGSFQTTFLGLPTSTNAFVCKFNGSGTSLIYSTFLGGSGSVSFGDVGNSITVDSNGIVYVTGSTTSIDFPTTPGAFQPSLISPTGNGFFSKINTAGTSLIYSTYLGGNDATPVLGSHYSDSGYSIKLDTNGNVYIAGQTSSSNFPTTNGAFQTSTNGNTEAFVTKFNASALFPATPTPQPSYSGPTTVGPGQTFVYPSPATQGLVNIAYDMEEAGSAEVSVWNESAELVADASQNEWTGPQISTFKTYGWAKGVYFYRVILKYNSGKTEHLPPGKFLVW